MTRLALLASIALSVAACYQTRLKVAGPGGGVQHREAFHHNFLGGLVEARSLDVGRACEGRGVSEISYEVSAAGQLANLVTYGIYTPVDAAFTCNGEDPVDTTPALEDAPVPVAPPVPSAPSAPPPTETVTPVEVVPAIERAAGDDDDAAEDSAKARRPRLRRVRRAPRASAPRRLLPRAVPAAVDCDCQPGRGVDLASFAASGAPRSERP